MTWTTILVGAAPMLRLFLSDDQNKTGTFIEGGAGVNLISRNKIGDRELGCAFIFSVMDAAGYKFLAGETPIFLSLRYRHVSNAGLYSANDGLDSGYLMVSLGF